MPRYDGLDMGGAIVIALLCGMILGTLMHVSSYKGKSINDQCVLYFSQAVKNGDLNCKCTPKPTETRK